jgi:hypothetical protein
MVNRWVLKAHASMRVVTKLHIRAEKMPPKTPFCLLHWKFYQNNHREEAADLI